MWRVRGLCICSSQGSVGWHGAMKSGWKRKHSVIPQRTREDAQASRRHRNNPWSKFLSKYVNINDCLGVIHQYKGDPRLLNMWGSLWRWYQHKPKRNINHSLLTEKQLGTWLWYGSNIWPYSWPNYYTSRIIIVGIFIRHTYSTYSCRQQVDYLLIFEDFTYEYYIYVIFMHFSLLNLSCVSPAPRLITSSSLLLSTHTCKSYGILSVLLAWAWI